MWLHFVRVYYIFELFSSKTSVVLDYFYSNIIVSTGNELRRVSKLSPITDYIRITFTFVIDYSLVFRRVDWLRILLIFFVPGAFLIPFFIMMVFIGFPLFFLELYIGQYTGLGDSNQIIYLSIIN